MHGQPNIKISHCSRFFTIADVVGLSIYSTFHFTNFEGVVGTVGHIADCIVPALSVRASKPHSLTFHFEYLLSLDHTEIIYALHSQIQAF